MILQYMLLPGICPYPSSILSTLKLPFADKTSKNIIVRAVRYHEEQHPLLLSATGISSKFYQPQIRRAFIIDQLLGQI